MAVAGPKIRVSYELLEDKIATNEQQQLEEEEATMVQVFMVVRCYSCKIFQVHQVKKTNKWLCKVCNEKQSVLKTYGKGAAKDCRKHVQKLNMLRGERERGSGRQEVKQYPPDDYAKTFTAQDGGRLDRVEHPVVLADSKRSKWTTFVEPPEDEEEDDGTEHTTTDRTVFSQACKSRRQETRQDTRDKRPHPLSPDTVCPYSSVNYSMDSVSSRSKSTTYSDRYTKLESSDRGLDTTDISSSQLETAFPPSTSVNHKERMSQIRLDLQQFSHQQQQQVTESNSTRSGPSGLALNGSSSSSRWSQFLCVDEDKNCGGGGGETSAVGLQSKQVPAV